MVEITVSQEKCTGCEACVEYCSVTHVYALENKKAKAISPSRCLECGQCVAVCPVDAITHSSFPLEACPIIERTDDDLEKLVGFIKERRSIRVYKDKRVAREKVDALVNTARWAPTGGNQQRISWLVVDDEKTIAALSKRIIEVLVRGAADLRNSVSPDTDADEQRKTIRQLKRFEHLERRTKKGENPVFFGAPVLLIGLTPRSRFVGRDDAVISGYTMQLTASQMGLATCQVGYFIAGTLIEKNLGRKILNIPEDQEVQMVLTLGYPKYKLRRMVFRKALSLEWVDD